jgi:membrane-associated phospholipid phosphatase
MTPNWDKRVPVFCLLLVLATLCTNGYARPQEPQGNDAPDKPSTVRNDKDSNNETTMKHADDSNESVIDDKNSIGVTFLKHLVNDQKDIWTSPSHLHFGDVNWIVPVAAFATVSLRTDTGISKAVTGNSSRVKTSNSFSNYGLAAMGGVVGGAFLLGEVTHDDRMRETGLLSGESALDAVMVTTALEYVFDRQRPGVGAGGGGFWHGGTSFPSNHATAVWAAASVIAHEYPGPLTKVLAYGLALAVSAARVTGKDHFPTDVIAGGSIGWFIGQHVYTTRHDPELGGDQWGPFIERVRNPTDIPPESAASPFVPLDSWVYPAFERLAAMGYITSALQGMKPWTRIECARLTEEVGNNLIEADRVEPTQKGGEGNDSAASLYELLHSEFAHELAVRDGEPNQSIKVDSVYTRVMSISGPILTDAMNFGGQTVSYDFGRPFERGTNVIAGTSASATEGPFAFYARVEYQHSPAAPSLPENALQFISSNDQVPLGSGQTIATVNRADLLEGYVSFSHSGWQVSAGKQAISWGVGEGGSLLLSDNAEPLSMIRVTRVIPMELPGFLRVLGQFRTEQFISRVNGGVYTPHPLMYGQKLSFDVTSFLEVGIARTGMLGRGADAIGGDPFTTSNFLKNFFGIAISKAHGIAGEDRSSIDFNLDVPGLNHRVTLYSEFFSNVVPFYFADPPDAAYRAGMFLPSLPHLHRVDMRFESTSTEAPIFTLPTGGYIFYWDIKYHGGYVNDGELMGNTVGRKGRAFQNWTTIHLSDRNQIQFTVTDRQVDPRFVPGGGLWQDYGVSYELRRKSGFYAKTGVQYEHIQHFPLLFPGSVNNVTTSLEIGFSPAGKK